MQKYYQHIIPRLNGKDIRRDFRSYLSLVRKGVAGFIIFGGDLETVRLHISRLQEEAELPLIIASDLERGLGQQLAGGTNFPPAMALASAVIRTGKDRKRISGAPLLRASFRALAGEAAYAGINTVFAPVLDINTNPKNPIIATRAFGEDAETVSLLGCEMISTLQRYGVAACGKHFPGHGDTEVDSHMKLPSVNRSLRELRDLELRPFKKAIEAGVRMIMLGHLKVPALDPSGTPVSVSGKAVGYLRRNMHYKGILITDAMNMGGLAGYSEEKASLMALKAGVDIILHPSNPAKVASYLSKAGFIPGPDLLTEFRSQLRQHQALLAPDFEGHAAISGSLTSKAIRVSGDFRISGPPLLVLLNDEGERRGAVFAKRLKAAYPGMRVRTVTGNSAQRTIKLPDHIPLIVAVFSETRGWKGGTGSWVREKLEGLGERAALLVSFGSPYLLNPAGDVPRMFVYWDSVMAEEAAARLILYYND